MKKILVLFVLLALICAPAFAQDPAVSAINGKVEALGGSFDGEEGKAAAGSLTIPLGERFGVQFDGAFGEIDDDEVKGGGIHLFTRDPELYLLGLTGVYAELENVQLERYGIEAEAYMDQFTLAVNGGLQDGDVDDSVFGSLDLRYYPMDNLMVEAGGSIADTDDGKVHLGAEYQVMAGLAVFADLATGENDYEHAMGGIRYYIGGEKSLVKRHREDDPVNSVIGSVIGGGGAGF